MKYKEYTSLPGNETVFTLHQEKFIGYFEKTRESLKKRELSLEEWDALNNKLSLHLDCKNEDGEDGLVVGGNIYTHYEMHCLGCEEILLTTNDLLSSEV